MDVFGSFRFGSLIKTFLPGLLWLVFFSLLLVTISEFSGERSQLLSFFTNKTSIAIAAAIPAAIILGLISNIVVFMGLNDILVRNPVKYKCPDIAYIHDKLGENIAENALPPGELGQSPYIEIFIRHSDPEIILLSKIDPEKIEVIRERYWFYMEFQINIFLILASTISLIIILIAYMCFWSAGESVYNLSPLYLGLFGIGSFFLCPLMIFAARKNYTRHLEKMMSLRAAMASSIGPAVSP